MIAEPVVTHTHVDDPMVPTLYRVERVRRDTADTFSIDIVPADGGTPPPFEAGQFNMLYVFGVGEVPISISCDPANGNPLVHTTRAVGAVTQAMSKLRAGDLVGVRGPYGTSWPVEAARHKDVVLVTGGIGLAPLRPAMYRILAERDEYGKVVLLYGARTPSDLLYRKQLERWRSQLDLDVYVTVDRATGKWHGNVGVVTKLIPRAPFDPHNTVALVCGPEIMMRYSAAELEKRGVPAKQIFLSMERNMKCAVRLCGHCQFGAKFVCHDGPVFRYDDIRGLMDKWEV